MRYEVQIKKAFGYGWQSYFASDTHQDAEEAYNDYIVAGHRKGGECVRLLDTHTPNENPGNPYGTVLLETEVVRDKTTVRENLFKRRTKK